MKRAFATTALAVAASVSTHVHAQSTNTTELDPILISGGISPVSADEYGRSSTVITRQQIRERGYATVQQALEAQPGVSITGDAPTNRQIRIRGGEGRHTLVLIDGVRAAAGDSEYVLRGLDASYIERIEVLRGPQSVPFGTDAASGVINIVTREAADGLGYGGSIEFGEGDRQNAYVSYGGDASQISVNLSNLNDRGFDYSGSNGNRDGRRWEAASAKGELDLTGQTTLGFSLRAADAVYDFDGTNTGADSAAGYVVDQDNRTELNERAGSVSVDHAVLGGRAGHRLRFDRTTEKEATESEDFGPSSTNRRTEVVNYRFQTALDGATTMSSDQLMSVLLERREDRDRDGEGERDNNSAALEYRGWIADRASLQAGVRRDNNSEFANETTWNVAGSYFLDNGVRWHASAGRAVVNPSFFDLTGGFGFQPNPDLGPEKNIGFDVGVEIPLANDGSFVDITYFNETLEDKIAAQFPEIVNLDGDSDRQGVELTVFLKPVDDVDVTLNYTYTDATDPDGNIETRRPRNEVGLNTTWRLPDGATTLSGDLRYVRGLFDQQFWEADSPREPLPNFTVVDLAASHALTDNVDLTTRVTNVFDEDYQEVWGYATRGRAVFAGLSASW